MFKEIRELKPIRFDVNENYLNSVINVNEWKRIDVEAGYVSAVLANVLTIKIRLNYSRPDTKEEVIGYLGERKAILNAKQRDKIKLLNLLDITVNEAEKYIKEGFTDFTILNYAPLNVDSLADSVLRLLDELE
jgi:hypothetical protein